MRATNFRRSNELWPTDKVCLRIQFVPRRCGATRRDATFHVKLPYRTSHRLWSGQQRGLHERVCQTTNINMYIYSLVRSHITNRCCEKRECHHTHTRSSVLFCLFASLNKHAPSIQSVRVCVCVNSTRFGPHSRPNKTCFPSATIFSIHCASILSFRSSSSSSNTTNSHTYTHDKHEIKACCQATRGDTKDT